MASDFDSRYRQAQNNVQPFLRALAAAQFLNEALEVAASAEEFVVQERKNLRIAELQKEHARLIADTEKANLDAEEARQAFMKESKGLKDQFAKLKAQYDADVFAASKNARDALDAAQENFRTAMAAMQDERARADAEFEKVQADRRQILDGLREQVTAETVRLTEIRRLREQLQRV